MSDTDIDDGQDNRFNEASVRLPAALVDRSMQMYTLADGGNAFNIVVSRSAVKPQETLDAFVDRLLDESRRTLAKFDLEDRHERLVNKVRGIELTFTWKSTRWSCIKNKPSSWHPVPSPANPPACS